MEFFHINTHLNNCNDLNFDIEDSVFHILVFLCTASIFPLPDYLQMFPFLLLLQLPEFQNFQPQQYLLH